MVLHWTEMRELVSIDDQSEWNNEQGLGSHPAEGRLKMLVYTTVHMETNKVLKIQLENAANYLHMCCRFSLLAKTGPNLGADSSK